jgi:uncharacterized protein YceH (UPF0502 family)
MTAILLNTGEARVIAALVEKSIATPAYYPMTVNGLMLAANQKSARNPVMGLTEGEVGAALNRLEEMKWVTRDSFSGRVQKWRQQFLHQLLLKPQTQAVLITLMLRGPQTLAELRAHAEALGGPRDHDALNAALQDLADRAQPLIVQLPRAPGQSAQRYAHTLCGAPAAGEAYDPAASAPSPGTDDPARPTVSALLARIEALEQRVATLEAAASAR